MKRLPKGPDGLSHPSRAVFGLLAKDYDIDEVIAADHSLNRQSITDAAVEALILDDATRVTEAWKSTKNRLPRTMTRWKPSDDAELAALVRGGIPVERISEMLLRPVSAIYRRLLMVNLTAYPEVSLPTVAELESGLTLIAGKHESDEWDEDDE